MAAMFVVGVSIGTWLGGSGDLATVAAADTRPRAAAGEPRLLLDQSLEQFGRKAGTPGRANALGAEPESRANADSAPKRSQQARLKSN